MKKLILLSFIVIGCVQRNPDGSVVLYNDQSAENPYIQVIDSCEYICWGRRMAHKGNCKFCTERRKQEIKYEMVENSF